AWREPRARAAALVGGLAAVAALGGAARPELSPAWAVVAYLPAALALSATVRVHALPAAVRHGLARAGAGVAALAALLSAAPVAATLGSRVRVLAEVWAGTTPDAGPSGAGVAPAVALLLTAGAAWWLSRALSRPEPAAVAAVLAWAGLFTVPVLLGLPPAAVFAVQLAVTGAAGTIALRAPVRATGIAAGACALLGALNVSLGALDGRTSTFAVWGLLGVLGAAGAAYGPAPRPARAGAAVCVVGHATGLLVASAALTDLAVVWWALPVLAVPATVAALGPRLGGVRLPVEIAAGVAGAVAVALSAGRAGNLALVLALLGVVCAGAAVRPERRVPGWAAALFVAATWVRLAEVGVTAPEAYGLPVTIPALAVGVLRRRRDPASSSWTAYGPGLSATLLPSLVAAWADPEWLRPLLLGSAALAVTLTGARRRLQAPLLLGGAVLAVVALHELAPYVV
ncbi:SCO7613 C-terminal domain-containing membrane protein, partial [Streptomyces sp. NPDC059233]